MRYFNIIICLLLFAITKAQNLVPNSSFENHSACPVSSSQVSLVTSWTSPVNNDADYFHACSSNSGLSVPNAGSGYQQAKTGNGFVGLYTYNGVNNNYREYIRTVLTSQLIANAYYKVTFYCSSMGVLTYATNNIGLNFSNIAINSTGTGNVLTIPFHIYKFNNPVISDSLNWTEISGIYQANGGEQYLTIGNFRNDINTDTLNSGNSNYPGAYYYIEDVNVENICTPFWGYSDTTVTVGDSVLIGPAITGLNINWYDSNNNFIANAPAIYVKPNSPTYYTASEDFCNGITTHTINVMVTPTSVKDYNAFTNSISLFPNPATNRFTISNLTESSKLKVDITDTQGELCSTELITITNNKTTIKINLPNGVYFVSITDNISGLKAVKKLIVQK